MRIVISCLAIGISVLYCVLLVCVVFQYVVLYCFLLCCVMFNNFVRGKLYCFVWFRVSSCRQQSYFASSILSVAVCNVCSVTVENSGIVVNCGVNYSSTHLIANLENESNGLKIVRKPQFGLPFSLNV